MQTPNAYVGSDERLQILSAEGAIQAFERILSSDLPSFYRKAYRLLGNTADGEDAVQDALLAAYTHLDQFKGQSQMSSWLSSIVLNCARMQLRVRRRFTVHLDEPVEEGQVLSMSERLADSRPNPEDECRGTELRRLLTRLRSQLSPTLRTTFQLRDIEGLPVREIARILGIPSGTVKARSSRARKRMKELMERVLRPRSRSLRDKGLACESSATSHHFCEW
jgi:RNA polymerase sigma-70 factor, ECF subfamily